MTGLVNVTLPYKLKLDFRVIYRCNIEHFESSVANCDRTVIANVTKSGDFPGRVCNTREAQLRLAPVSYLVPSCTLFTLLKVLNMSWYSYMMFISS